MEQDPTSTPPRTIELRPAELPGGFDALVEVLAKMIADRCQIPAPVASSEQPVEPEEKKGKRRHPKKPK
jgi:hypothetical protein